MIGNRVRVVLEGDSTGRNSVTGVLHKIDQAGVMIWVECSLPEGRGNSFIPMHRIFEIVDLGRAP